MSLLGDSLSPFVQTTAHSQVCPQHNVYQGDQLYLEYQLHQERVPTVPRVPSVASVSRITSKILQNFIIFMFRSECEEYIQIIEYIGHKYLFAQSFISIFLYESIRTLVCVKFVCMNIFKHSFVSNCWCKYIWTFVLVLFSLLNIFGYSFALKFLQMLHSGLGRRSITTSDFLSNSFTGLKKNFNCYIKN